MILCALYIAKARYSLSLRPVPQRLLRNQHPTRPHPSKTDTQDALKMGRPKPSVAETSYSPQSLPDSHIIVQLGPPRGSSQFISTDPEQTERLVELSQRLKRSGMLAQRGDFGVVNLYAVDPKAEAGGKAKGVEGEVVCVWTEKEVRAFRRGGEWYVQHGVLIRCQGS